MQHHPSGSDTYHRNTWQWSKCSPALEWFMLHLNVLSDLTQNPVGAAGRARKTAAVFAWPWAHTTLDKSQHFIMQGAVAAQPMWTPRWASGSPSMPPGLRAGKEIGCINSTHDQPENNCTYAAHSGCVIFLTNTFSVWLIHPGINPKRNQCPVN